MNRQNTQESEQMITTEGQIMSSCRRSIIFLFNSTILHGDYHFVVDLFNFEPRVNNDQSQRSRTEETRETETDSIS